MIYKQVLLLVALCAAAAAAPAPEEERVEVSKQATTATAAAAAAAAIGPSELETAPALRVRMSPGNMSVARAGCTDTMCYELCQSLNWKGGFCFELFWCLCY